MQAPSDPRRLASVGFYLLAGAQVYFSVLDIAEPDYFALTSDAILGVAFVLAALAVRRAPRRHRFLLLAALLAIVGFALGLAEAAPGGMGVDLVTSLFSVVGWALVLVGALGLRRTPEGATERNIVRIGLATALVEPVLWAVSGGDGSTSIPGNLVGLIGYGLAVVYFANGHVVPRAVPVQDIGGTSPQASPGTPVDATAPSDRPSEAPSARPVESEATSP